MENKTIKEIIQKGNTSQQNLLGKFVDKSIPAEFLEKRLDMLKTKTAKSLTSLVLINHLFKMYLLSEVTLVEDMLATGIYKNPICHKTIGDLIKSKEIFDKNPNSKKLQKFITFIKNESKSRRKDYNTYILTTTLSDLFSSLTLGGKIVAVSFFDRDFVSGLFSSNRTKYTKKDLINSLETAKKIRNHVAHNFFILNKGPYLRMVNDMNFDKKTTEQEKINYLFSQLKYALKISSRGEIISKIKSNISKGNDNLSFADIDCLIFKK